jgi:hypothetical protein
MRHLSNLSFDRSARPVIRAELAAGGYTSAQIDRAMEYAHEQGACTGLDGYVLAMSRILYTDEQLADGARFCVEA